MCSFVSFFSRDFPVYLETFGLIQPTIDQLYNSITSEFSVTRTIYFFLKKKKISEQRTDVKRWKREEYGTNTYKYHQPIRRNSASHFWYLARLTVHSIL